MGTYLYITLLTFYCFIGTIAPERKGDNASSKVMFCYYSAYAQTRPSIGKFLPEDIDPHLCTHIIFAFADVVEGIELEPSNRNDEGRDGLYKRTVALKKENPKLKVLLAIGGWAAGSTPFVPLMKSTVKRKRFIRNVVFYLRRHGFDGLDMDWEFPGVRGSAPEDKFKFTELMRGLQDAFRRESQQMGRDKLLLTLATACGSYFINAAYEIRKIHRHVDFLLLMAYNYHGSWNNYTGHHAGLYPRSEEVRTERELNQEWSVSFWLRSGAPPSKLVLGIPTYGMSFTLEDPRYHGLDAPAVGGGEAGTYTKEKGILSFYEICKKIHNGWNYIWIDEQKVPYAYSRDQWVGFDDKNSVKHKAEYILYKNLAGAFIWSVEMDDFQGICGEGQYPLLTTIHDVLNDQTKAETRYVLSNVDRDGFSRNAPRSPEMKEKQQASHISHIDATPTIPYKTVMDNQDVYTIESSKQHYSKNSELGVYHGEPKSAERKQVLEPEIFDQQQEAYNPHGNILEERYDNYYQGKRQTGVNYSDRQYSGSLYECQTPGIHDDPTACDCYFICIKTGRQWNLYRMQCPENLAFDARTKSCVYDDSCR